MTNCLHCERRLVFDVKRGWCHEWPPNSGTPGSYYLVRCSKCGRKTAQYPTLVFCDRCGGQMVDDHCALPKAYDEPERSNDEN